MRAVLYSGLRRKPNYMEGVMIIIGFLILFILMVLLLAALKGFAKDNPEKISRLHMP
jgi:hypothetical protein